jgi:membrane protein YdbS with pleckstrin-like domain
VDDGAGQDLVWRGLDPRLLRLWQLLWTVGLVVPGLVLGVLAAVLAGPVEGVGVLVVVAVLLVQALVVVRRRFRAWSYAERADDLLLRRGVLLRRTTVVPYGRMQFVDVSAGPLDRRFGLAKVVLHTASSQTDSSIPGLAEAEATRLRDRLAALGEARAAGV